MKSILPLIFCFLFYSCEKMEDIHQRVLFQVEYANAAWGLQHTIWVVDSSGVVSIFDLPAGWNRPDSNGYLSLNEMNENISRSCVFKSDVDEKDLKKYFNLLDEAEMGQLTDPESVGNDGGSRVYSGFLYDSQEERYQQVLIRQTGDIYIENKSSAARKIYNWLRPLCLQ